MKKYFASDNCSGAHPKIVEALVRANVGHDKPYGNDDITAEAQKKFREIFGDVSAFFVMNGTGANVLCLEACKGKGTSVICPESGHIFTDETGALSNVTGLQMLTTKTIDGKIDLEDAKKYLSYQNTTHRCHPNTISISQATELGTIYTLDELKAISKFAKEHGMYFHMDGARISNATVHLGCTLKEMTGDLGVDILSFGGQKNGIMFGESVVIFNKSLVAGFELLRKQCLQLNSKMRYSAAQFLEYLSNNLWYENAKNANDMAKYFADELKKVDVKIVNEVNGNTLFAIFPKNKISPMQDYTYFYTMDEEKN
ncbi:MAG: threonine aldolase family protein, partial [Fusobacteriaceae bacterium]